MASNKIHILNIKAEGYYQAAKEAYKKGNYKSCDDYLKSYIYLSYRLRISDFKPVNRIKIANYYSLTTCKYYA